MPTDPLEYTARLNRGWSWVRLTYTLDTSDIVVHEQRVPGGVRDRRVPIADLTGEVHTVFARQPVYRFSLLVAAIAAMAMVLDFARAYMMPGGEHALYWPVWIPAVPVAVIGVILAWSTRKPREWAQFKGRGTGVFILKDRRDADAYARFMKALTRRIADAGGR